MSCFSTPIKFEHNFPKVGQLVQVHASGLEGKFIEGTVTCRGGNFSHPMGHPIGRDFWFAISYIDKHDGQIRFLRVSQCRNDWLADLGPSEKTMSCDVALLS